MSGGRVTSSPVLANFSGRRDHRCLAKDPPARFQTGEALAAALEQAPELRRDLPLPLRAFLAQMEPAGRGSTVLFYAASSVVSALAGAVVGREYGALTGALCFTALILADPLLRVLPAARRVFRAGSAREEIVRELSLKLERRKQTAAFQRAGWEMHAEKEEKEERKDWPLRHRVAAASLGLWTFGMLVAMSGLNVPDAVIRDPLVVGAVVFAFAGPLAWLLDRERPVAVERWLKFWNGVPGRLAARVLGARTPATPALAPPVRELPDILHLTGARMSRLRALVETLDPSADSTRRIREKIAHLEELYRRVAADPETADPGSLTAAMEEARVFGLIVDELLDGVWGL